MPPIKRIEETADLVSVPHIATLELRERHVPAVDMIENR
jgi:hypothetical protein